MKSKKLPEDTKVAVYMRVGREEQLSPQDKLINAVSKTIETETGKMSFKFTAEQVKVLRDALLTYNKPEEADICADLFEHLGNRLRDYREKEREC
jgi:hypothetical protein